MRQSFNYFLFDLDGTPPLSYAGKEVFCNFSFIEKCVVLHWISFEVEIEIVGLNKMTYETKCITIQLFIDNKHQTPVNTVQMKIDNLNWVQLMDPGRVENLKNIFRYRFHGNNQIFWNVHSKNEFLETIYGLKAKKIFILCLWNQQLKWEVEFLFVPSKKKGSPQLSFSHF